MRPPPPPLPRPPAPPGLRIPADGGGGSRRNLKDAGYDVTVWNRTASKCDELKSLGCAVAATPAEVASSADVTFGMLSTPEVAQEVFSGPAGVLEGLGAGKSYVDCSTVDVQCAASIAEAAEAKGARFLEAPVSGSKGPAINGALIFLTGGSEDLYQELEHPLGIMGKKSYFFGPVGSGAKMKLIVNTIMGSMMVAFAEGLSLTEKLGLSQEDLIDVISHGAIATPMYALKGPAMKDAKYPTAFPLKHQQKDVRLALECAAGVDQKLPMSAAAMEMYKAATARGLEDEDFSAVLEALKH